MMLQRILFVAPVAVSAVVWSYGCSSGETGPSGAGGASTSTSSTTATSTGTSTETMATVSSASSGKLPLVCNETYTTVPKGDCDLLQQDCPVGKVCGVVPEGDSLVSNCIEDLGGLTEIAGACASNSECKGGMQCVNKVCSPVCCPGSNEPCAGGACDVSLTYENKPGTYSFACSYAASCELFAGTCKDGAECHLSDASACLAVCDEPASSHVAEGQACIYRNDCGESQLCNKNPPDKGTCRNFCDLMKLSAEPGKGGCLPIHTCTTVSGTGCENLGLCLPK